MKRLIVKNSESIRDSIHSYFNRNDEAKFIHRLHGVLLFIEKEDESCDSIGALFGNSPRTVSNWIRRVNETGDIGCLRSKKQPGRTPRLSAGQKQELSAILHDSPEKHGVLNKRWDGKSLSAYIGMRYGIVMETRTCQALIRKLGFSSRRAYADVVSEKKKMR
jgi:transposase